MLNIGLSVHKTDGTTQNGKILLQKKDGGDFYAVFADVALGSGTISATEGIVCKIDNLPKGRFVCDYMRSTCWCSPAFGEDYKDVPDRTQAILISSDDGYLCILSLVGKQYKTVLKGEENALLAISYTGVDSLSNCDDPLLVYGYGKNPYVLLKDTYRFAIETMNRNICMREEREFPKKLEYLGWCTWDAMHIHVSAKGIKEKCTEFQEKSVPIKWAMIDDMWADCPHLNEIPEDLGFWDMIKEMYKTKMRSFTADPIRFPNGLKDCVEEVKKFGIETAIWFPSTGYWAGFLADGEIAKQYAEDLITLSDGMVLVKPQRKSFDKIYTKFAEYILENGGSFIKIDRQSFAHVYIGIRPIGEIVYDMQNSMENIANTYFDGAIINCMGMAAENAYNREKTAIIRCSDDFLPNDSEWFKRHINDCAYNTLFWGNLYYTDWDMFWTNDAQAKKNTVLHALSGGPVYISDKIGETKGDVLTPLCLSDGRLIRAENSLVPIFENLFIDARKEEKLISLFNRKNGCVAIASFNLFDKELEQKIALQQFSLSAEKICVYDWFNNSAKIYDAIDDLTITLKNAEEVGLYILSPIQNGFAVVGDTKKYLSPYIAERNGSTLACKKGEITLVSEKELSIIGATKTERNGNTYRFYMENEGIVTVEIK